MAKKRPGNRRRAPAAHTAATAAAPPSPWRQRLLLLTILPMLIGILLFVGAWADVIIFGSQTAQTVTGAVLALGGFAAANALQGRLAVAGGWALLAVSIALLVGQPTPWAVTAGAITGGVGVVVVAIEFIRRFQRPI